MLARNSDFLAAAIQLAPRLSVIACDKGQVTESDVREAIRDARAFGEDVRNFQSDRSLRLIEQAYSNL